MRNPAPAEDAPDEAHTRYEKRRQEQQVRLTAQEIVTRNLRVVDQGRRRWWDRRPSPAAPAWPGINLKLTDAVLVKNFSLMHCQLCHGDFGRAQFTGRAYFGRAEFTGGAGFERAQFTGWADFTGAQIIGVADFGRAQFTGSADFRGVQYDEVKFEGARVASEAAPKSVWPRGWMTRPAKPEDGEDPAFHYLVKVAGTAAVVD